MAKKKETPHLDKWLRTFKSVGTTAGKVAVQTLGSMAPGVSETMTSSADVLRESKAFMSKARNQIAYQSKIVNRNSTGRKASNIMNDALNDLKNGNFKIDKLGDSAYESLDEFDANINDLDSTITAGADPAAVELAESKKNTAILGRAIAEGSYATIEGINNMTSTLANVNIKTTKSAIAQMTNVTLMGINQMNSGLAGVNGRLDAINKNLMSMMDFQRSNTAILHEQTLQYQQDTVQMMHEMGSVLSEMQDFIQSQKEIDKKKGPKVDPFDFSGGFNARTYVDMVKNNFNNSIFGMLKSMGGMTMSMSKMSGESPLELFAPMIISSFLPESIQKTVGRFDKAFTQGMNNILYRIGDMRNSTDFLKQTVGQLFGKERDVVLKPRTADYKRGAMSWNGEAQKYLTEVIPGYLARIEAGVTKSEARYYNSDKGVFQHEGRIKKDFNKDFVNTLEFNMNGFAEELEKALSKSGMSERDMRSIKTQINESVIKALMSDSTSASRNRQETMNLINSTLQGKVDSTTIHDIIREATSGLDQTTSALNETLSNLNSAARNLFTGQIKGKTSDLYKGANVFSGKRFTAYGKDFDDLTEAQRQTAEFNEMLNSDEGHGKLFDYAMKKMFGPNYKSNPKYKQRFEKYDPKIRKKAAEEKRRQRYHKFDSATDRMYDWMSGYDFRSPYDEDGVIHMPPSNNGTDPRNGFQAPAIIRSTGNQRQQKASSNFTQTRRSSNIQRVSNNVNRSVQTMDQRDYNASLNQSETRMVAQANATSKLVHQLHSSGNEAGPSNQALLQDPSSAIVERLNDNETSLKSMVLSLNDNFLSPIVGGLFGKNGFFRRIFSKDSMKKFKDMLFDEKDGVFKDVTPWFKDQMDYIRYTFNGKAYTDRKGNKHEENENSVFDHIAKGYDFVYSNTMKYLFGDDYKDNDTYNKYFKWMDFKGKRDQKRQDRIKKAKEEEQRNARSSVNNQRIFINGNTAGLSLEDIEGLNSYEVSGYLPGSSDDIIDAHFREISGPNKALRGYNKKSTSQAKLALPGPVTEPEVIDAASFEIIPAEDAKHMGETVQYNLITASETASNNIVEASTALSTAVLGDFEDNDIEKKAEEANKRNNKNFFDKFKKWLPKGLAAGVIGGIFGSSVALHGSGVLGSLLLPGGPVSGAILGVAASILWKNQTFQKILFGEEKDGKKTGGLISNKTQEFFKKNLPLIVGTATLGALKGIFTTAIGSSGPTGFLLGSLLPGGPIGGAVLGLGIGLLKNNERFNKILFGEKNEDGKRDGGILNKGMSGIRKAFSKSMKFVKGGVKGAAVGAGSGLVLSQMGLVGSALSMGGPIGMGLMGLGLGIASQADHVKELLFGTEEFDENGNSKGRRKDGLFHKVRNMLVVNVFDPIKSHLTEKVEDFAYWAKDKIMYPFRLAFGPILDSMKGIKKDISDAVHETFNNIAETVGKAMKAGVNKLFSPLTKTMGIIGEMLTSSISGALKLSLAPLTGGLKLMQFATHNARKRAKGEERKTIREHLGTIYTGVKDATKAQWENDDRDYGTGIGGRINRFLTHGKDIIVNTRQGFDTAKAAYRAEMGEQGFNSLNWMNVEDERKMDKKNREKLKKDRKRWKEIDKVRNKVAKEHNFGEAYLSNEGLEIVRDRFEKAGLDRGLIKNNEDLNNLLYNKTDFIDQLDKDKSGEAKIKDSAATQDFYATTKDYQKFVMDRFNFITKEFTKFAAQNALSKKQNLKISDLEDIDKDLKSKGLTWKDIEIDPSRLANYGGISDLDWDTYMNEKFSNGEVKDDPTGFSKLIKQMLEERDQQNHQNEAIIEGLNDLNATTEANMRMNMSAQAISTGASESDVEEAAGFNASSKTFKLSSLYRKNKERSARLEQEKEESEKAKLGHHSMQDDDKKEENEAKLGNEDIDEATKKSKSTVFDLVGGFFKKVFGSVGGWFSDGTVWKAAGVGTVVAALFGKQICGFLEKAYSFLEPYLNKAKEYLAEKVPEFLHNAGQWLSENGPVIAEKITSLVVDNMSYIVDNAAKIIGSVLTTIGKKVANKFAQITGAKELPYPEVASGSDKAQTFESEEAAQVAAEAQGKNAYKNQILATNQYVDEDGDVRYVEDGSSSLKSTAVREGIQFARSKTNRKMAKTTLKYGGKTLGWISGITPVGKVVKGTVKAGIGIGKAGVKGGKAIINGGKAIYNKFGKKTSEALIEEGTEELVEETAKYGAKTAGKEATEAVVKNGAGSLAERTSKAVIGSTAENVTKNTAEAVTKNSAKIAGAATGYLDDAGKWVSKATHQSQIEKSIARNASKTAGKSTGEAVVKKAAEATLENVVDSPAAKSGLKKVISDFFKKAKSIVKGAADKVKKFIKVEKFTKFVDDLIDTIIKKLSKSNNKLFQKVGEKIAEKTAIAAGKTAADATVIIGVGFAIFDGINGALNAAYLFGVDDSDVTAGMRAVSSIMEILLGTAPGAWIDILLEVWNMITGFNAKQWMARKLYTALGGDAEKLDESIAEMEAETEKYNKINNTNISVKEYNELKNQNKSIGGRIKQGWSWLTSSKEEYDKKYNFDQYAVTDEELEKYKASKNKASSTSDLSYGSGKISNKAYPPMTPSSNPRYDLMYGPGRIGQRYYGPSNQTQGDPRWANFELGKFPDGGTSTMATGGCGPTALSMVAEGFGKNTTPLKVADYAKKRGFIQDGGATSDLFTQGAADMGLNSTSINKSSLKENLRAGNPVIVSGKSRGNGPYTEAGHVIVASGLAPNGDAIVNDPLRGKMTVSTGSIERGMTHGWSFSGNGVSYGDGRVVGYGPTAGVTAELGKMMTAQKGTYFEYLGKKYKTVSDGLGNVTYQAVSSDAEIIGYTKLALPPVGFTPDKSLATNFTGLPLAGVSLTTANLQNQYAKPTSTTKSSGATSATDNFSTWWLPGPAGLNSNLPGSDLFNNLEDKKLQSMKESATMAPSMINTYLAESTFSTLDAVALKVKSGKYKSGGEYRLNQESFYRGMKVADLKLMAMYDSTLLTNDAYSKFRAVYNYFVKSEDFKMNRSINDNEIKSIFGRSTFIQSLGGNGRVEDWEYKYGLPFYQTDDSRWADIPWRGESVKTRGGDLASLGMVASVFGPNMLSPDYINQNWLNINPGWWDSTNGLVMDKVFTDGGFNAMKASQVDGQRVQTKKLVNVNSILSELRLKRPVVLTGYRYKGSIFGGDYDKSNAPISGADDYSTVVARAADDTHLAVLDPFTTLDQSGAFEISRLEDKVGSSGKSAIINAYSIAGPNGEGVSGRVDISEKEGGTSDYTSISDAKGIEKVAAIFKNFAAVGSHFLDMIVSEDHAYRSIYEINQIEGDGADEAGVGTAIITDENGNQTYVSQDENNKSTASVDGVSAVEYFLSGGKYYLVKSPGLYQYISNEAFNAGKLNGWKKIDVPEDFKNNQAVIYTSDDTENLVTSSTKQPTIDSNGVVKVTLPTTQVTTPQVVDGSAITVNPNATTNSGSSTHISSSGASHGGGGHSLGPVGYGGGFRDLVFGPTMQQHKGSNNMTSSPNRNIKYIVIHYTAGVSSATGAAKSTAEWFDNPKAGGSADFIVDDGSMIQYNPDPKNQYCHAVGGDKYSSITTSLGGRLYGIATNSNSVSIEMTSNKANKGSLNATDSDWSFTENTLANGASLANQLMSEYGIPKDNVIMHHEVNGKLCPAMWTQSEDKLSGWREFQNRLNGQSAGITIGADSTVGVSDGSTATIGNETSVSTQTKELPSSEKMMAYVNASMASMMGDDYESAKAQYLDAAAGSTQTTGSINADGTYSASVGNYTFAPVETGDTKSVPEGFGSVMSYMGWQSITSPSSMQYKLKQEAMGFDSDGIGKVGDRFAIAVKPYYGLTGDLLDVKYKDGTVLKGIVADVKGSENEPGKGQSKYINMESNKRQLQMGVTDRVHADGSVVEWVVDKYNGGFQGYGGNKTVASIHPEYKKDMANITKVGNFWENATKVGYGIGDLFAKGFYGIGSMKNLKAIGYGTMDWLSVVQDVKNQIAANGKGYSYGGNVETITSNGYTRTFRTDCSGFVSICLSCYLGKNIGYSSSTFSGSCPDISGSFTKISWPGWEGLQSGDILVNPSSHAEIFARNEGGRHLVWNCGSDSSCNSAAPTGSAKSSYQLVWRPNNPGSGASVGIAQNLITTGTNGTSGGAEATQQAPSDPFSKMLYNFKNAANKAMVSPDGQEISFGPGTPGDWFTSTLGGKVTSGYGKRSTQLGNEYHRGMDISASEGQNILSPIDGEIVSTGTDVAGYGNYAVVRDNDGNNHIFAHMKNPVGYGIGSTVSRNDVIGQVGSTGNATGDHLHYEIRKNGNKYSAINPMSFKYDSTGKPLNINTVNTAPKSDIEPIGSGNRDVSTEAKEKLNIAIETTNIEDKMDTMIEALKLMVDGLNRPTPASSNTVNNTTTNVSYGTGSGKTSSTKKSSKSSTESNDVLSLSQMHKSIATRR